MSESQNIDPDTWKKRKSWGLSSALNQQNHKKSNKHSHNNKKEPTTQTPKPRNSQAQHPPGTKRL